MPLRLHGFADFANYQLPEIGSILHEVTLGGTGKERDDRHPKVRDGVPM
jgi:hypothetical protein